MKNAEKMAIYGSTRPSMVLYDITIGNREKEFITLKRLVDGVNEMLKNGLTARPIQRIARKEKFLNQQFKELMSGKKIELFSTM